MGPKRGSASRVARRVGRLEESRELEARERGLQTALSRMWDDESSLYLNKRWRNATGGGAASFTADASRTRGTTSPLASVVTGAPL